MSLTGYVPPESGRNMDMTDIRLSNPKPLFNRAKKAEVGFVAVKVFRDENTCEMGFEASEIRVSTELWIGNNDFLIHKTTRPASDTSKKWMRIFRRTTKSLTRRRKRPWKCKASR